MPDDGRCRRTGRTIAVHAKPNSDEFHVNGWRYQGRDDVVYQRRTLLVGGPIVMTVAAIASALGNRRRRMEAERRAAPQWRMLGPLIVRITPECLRLSNANASGSVWLASIVAIEVAEEGCSLDLFFDSDPPIRFEGREAASLARNLHVGLRLGCETPSSLTTV